MNINFVWILLFSLFFSCENEKKQSSKNNKINKTHSKEGFIGTWKIDETLSNKNRKIVDSSNLQLVTFNEKSIRSIIYIDGELVSDRILGNWKVEKDTLIILNKKNIPELYYSFFLSKNNLTLTKHDNKFRSPFTKPIYLSRINK
jgi:hypothetical protein